ncbi:MAG TPA: CoA-binding protein [Candidatus Kapabacteria bacterium]|nr:CoA-binding protein [Candidatus Kapabacteria bacterium]
MNDARRILGSSRNILLVDWPNAGVPRALLEAGHNVFGYSPHRYTVAELSTERPGREADVVGMIPSPGAPDAGWLVFRALEGRPASVDVVAVYRPEAELPGIIAEHALPLGARVLWLQRPAASDEERAMIEEQGLLFVEYPDMAEAARSTPGAERTEG